MLSSLLLNNRRYYDLYLARSMASHCLASSVALWKLIAILCLPFEIFIAAHPTTHNLSGSGEDQPMCGNYPSWVGATGLLNPNDCLDALHRLENSDRRFFRTLDFEFMAPGATPRTNLPKMKTPRKYVHDSCTLVIAMLSTFPQSSLPGQGTRRLPYASTDTSRFSYLWSIAAWVDADCLSKNQMLGWCATGESLDIGVFVWATGSEMNKRINGIGSSSYLNSAHPSNNTIEPAGILDINALHDH